MKKLQNCTSCSAALPADAPEALCPACLLKCAMDSAATVMYQPTTENELSKRQVHYFGDYELLEEIARGGMGVVYRARQTSLNRIVAVKMILAGQLASEADILRFHTEAEAAANLQHPNIVTIHEIGEHEGRHYFSMDYVDGQNLAQVAREKALSPMQAARQLKLIAEAIQYAHQRGILHRDLKPQNVLIDSNGQPRVTDFGLAKREGADSGLTQTGAIMGSPSYMPPEQASGQHDRMGPASDVYSLGAILYELLTGKAPFVGETPIATLRKVLEEDPVPPSKLNSSVPSDLETICLKCLEKSPERRYSTARALVEELNRFLNNDPILARPTGVFRRVTNLAQKHPWLVTCAVCSLAMILFGLLYWQWSENKFLVWLNQHPGYVRQKRHLSKLVTNWSLFLWAVMSVPISSFRAQARSERKQGLVTSKRVLRGNAVSGALAISFATYLLMRGIDAFVWENLPIFEGFLLGFALFCAGVGSLVFVFKEYRMATLGIPNTFWDHADRVEQLRTTRHSSAQIAVGLLGMAASMAFGIVPNYPNFDWEHFAVGFLAWLFAFFGVGFWQALTRLQWIAAVPLLLIALVGLAHEVPKSALFIYIPLPILIGVCCGRFVFRTQAAQSGRK